MTDPQSDLTGGKQLQVPVIFVQVPVILVLTCIPYECDSITHLPVSRPVYWQWKPPLKLSDCGRKIQNYVHTDTYYCKPKLVSWQWLNITVFYARFLSPTDQKYAESSTHWQFLDYRPPVNFDWYTLKCEAKNSTSIYLYIYIYITLSIIDMDFLYR